MTPITAIIIKDCPFKFPQAPNDWVTSTDGIQEAGNYGPAKEREDIHTWLGSARSNRPCGDLGGIDELCFLGQGAWSRFGQKMIKSTIGHMNLQKLARTLVQN